MGEVVKYKILTLIEDRIFKYMILIFFIILNYEVFLNSGMLSDGSEKFNEILKYTLLINNYTITSTIFGLLIGIYVGSGFIGNDIMSGKIYIMILSFPKRWKYLLGVICGLAVVITGFVFLILLNYFVSTVVLNVSVNIYDLIQCFTYILVNMIVVMIVTAVASIFFSGKASLIVGIAQMAIFNIYTFEKIPFIDYSINISIKTRRILACIAPISNVSPPSIYNDGSLSRYIVTPILVNNMLLYQMIFIFFILIIGVIGFKYKEL